MTKVSNLLDAYLSEEDTMKRRRSGILSGAFLMVLSLVAIAQTRVAAATVDSVAEASYYDTSTSAFVSAAGYGGPGSSGGAGDNILRLFNSTKELGTLCAMIYVFDDNEEMQTCCGCPVSSNGLRTLSTLNDLTLRFGVAKGNLNAGVIEVLSSQLNFDPGEPPFPPLPPGTNGNDAGACSPTGSFGDPIFQRGDDVELTAGIHAHITHAERQQPGNLPGKKAASGVSVSELEDADPDDAELLEENCEALISNGSGTGVCSCGVGDSNISS
jgi:hypothetical protein